MTGALLPIEFLAPVRAQYLRGDVAEAYAAAAVQPCAIITHDIRTHVLMSADHYAGLVAAAAPNREQQPSPDAGGARAILIEAAGGPAVYAAYVAAGEALHGLAKLVPGSLGMDVADVYKAMTSTLEAALRLQRARARS